MRYNPLPVDFFRQNRERFSQQLKPNALAVFHANDKMPKSADQEFQLWQNSDLYYLTGIDQEESILVLFPEHPQPEMRALLFLRKTSPEIAVWEGAKLTKEEARELTGISSVYWLEDFDKIFPTLMNRASACYVNMNEHDRFSSEVPYKDLRFAREIQNRYPAHELERANPIMKDLRAVKQDEEIAYMQHATDITKSAFERVLKFVKPGVKEYEIEAEITHEFIRSGAQGHSYDPIVASGGNACVLHYITNDDVCKDGETILFDFGASYAHYAADMSRVIPVNGRFTQRQKAVYQSVEEVFRQAKQHLVPGAKIRDIQEAVTNLIGEELIKLEVLSGEKQGSKEDYKAAVKKYFPHGVSHHLGLDVHDIPDRERPLEAGMVLTCEPGIYLPDEGIGVRLENDIMVTNNGPYDLMEHIPMMPDQIEDIMNS
jgi:Xaa-Pro aminopeptidase